MKNFFCRYSGEKKEKQKFKNCFLFRMDISIRDDGFIREEVLFDRAPHIFTLVTRTHVGTYVRILFPSIRPISILFANRYKIMWRENGEFTERINRFPNGRTNPKLKATKSRVFFSYFEEDMDTSFPSPLIFSSLSPSFSRQFFTVKIRRVNRDDSTRASETTFAAMAR